MPIDRNWLETSFDELSDITPLGGGGQKWVFEADHPEYGAIVLKLYHPRTDPDRALREARTGHVLENPFVPSVFESGVTDFPLGELVWIFEERVLGRSLRTELTNDIETEQILRWAQTLLNILVEAETNEIVHRDVKPENVLIDNDGHSWLLDFGLARHLDLESITATEASWGVGTPGYSPPEQFLNLKGKIDSRSDLFGLGVTLYECVEGSNPFIEDAEDTEEVFRRILNRQLPPISRTVVESRSFRDLILAMTRREQVHRPRTVREAHDWMEDILREAGI